MSETSSCKVGLLLILSEFFNVCLRLKINSLRSFETSVSTHHLIWCNVTEGSYENVKSCNNAVLTFIKCPGLYRLRLCADTLAMGMLFIAEL